MDSVNPINPIHPSTNNSYHSDSPDLNGAINNLLAQSQNSNPDYNAINQAIDQLESGLSGKLNPLQSDLLNRLKTEAQYHTSMTPALCEMVVGELSPQVLVVEASEKNPDYNAIQSLLNNIQNYNPLVANSTSIPTAPQQLFNKIKEEFANAKDAPPFLNDVEQLNSYNNNPPSPYNPAPPFPPFRP